MKTLMGETVHATVHYEDGGDGWVMATIPKVPETIGQGRTREQARESVIGALQLALTPDEQLAGSRATSEDELLTLIVQR
jgi:predicted RNase H-like HicB family nuclease